LIAAREAAGFTNATLFLAAVKEAEGKAPSYSTYAQWESGSVTPRRSSLRIVEHYHATHQTGAGTAPAPVAAPDLASALVMLAEEIANLRLERDAMREERAAVRAEAEALRQEREAWARGVVTVLRAGAAGRVPAALLDALAPLPS
jgi:hypothetical protein